MNTRPKLYLKSKPTDTVLDTAVLLLQLGMWIIVVVGYIFLPTIIPIHFNFKGEVDRYGNKAELFVLPILSSIVTISFYYLNKVPHIFNYMVEITKENAEIEYRKATRMLRWVNLGSSLLILFIIIAVVIKVS
jgi:uncharacterized membrane protein